MFKHSLFYNAKILFRNQESLLWGLLFPLVYGLVYMLAFQGVAGQTEQFDAIPVAVVYQGTAEEQTSAKDLLANIATVGSIDKNGDGNQIVESDELATGDVDSADYPLLIIETPDIEKAQEYLSEGLISQAIYTSYEDNQLHFELSVAPSATTAINSSIVYSILQSFSSSTNAFTLLYENVASLPDPRATMERLDLRINEINDDQTMIVSSDSTKNVSSLSNYYYVALAYVCIFYMSIGINLVLENEANYSVAALRETVSASKKPVRFFSMFINSTIPALAVVYLLLTIYHFNDVPIGNETGRILLLMTIGPITGMLLGCALASLFKFKAEVVQGVAIALPLIFGLMSGMMAYDIKIWIVQNLPILNKLNPVALINDAFYYLNYYPTYNQYNQNILILCAISFACLIITLIGIRRTDYENL